MLKIGSEDELEPATPQALATPQNRRNENIVVTKIYVQSRKPASRLAKSKDNVI